jgi:hypothetical protein
MSTDHNDGLTIAQLVRVAAAQFVREMRRGADPIGLRMDIYRKVEVPDSALTVLKRAHVVGVRIKVTCDSLVFEGPATTAVIPPASLPSR